MYDELLQKLIHEFKYNQKVYLRHLFSELIINFIEQYRLDLEQFDLVIPIPLSPTRLRERGFNQSQFLAEDLAKAFDLKLSLHHLKRHVHTKSQTLLGEKERWTNIQGAFRIKNSYELINKNILIVDDLLTTGASASEAARTLKEHGAQTVGVLTLGITI